MKPTLVCRSVFISQAMVFHKGSLLNVDMFLNNSVKLLCQGIVVTIIGCLFYFFKTSLLRSRIFGCLISHKLAAHNKMTDSSRISITIRFLT